MDVKCELCNFTVKRKSDLSRHQKSENCKKISTIINTILNEKDSINKIIKVENEKIKRENEILKLENVKFKEINKEKDTQIKIIQEKYEDLRKIVEKAATKSTKTVKNNYTHNNYLNYISQEPLKISEISNQMKQIVNCETVMYDDDNFHEHIVDNILKDKDGKDKVLCTDINRKNFSYKDENSGELISDPELEKLREQLRKGTDIKQIRKDLLEKLVVDYEENGYIGIDPYKQFSEIIKKLNFGTPFVDHVAKKTYIKTKSGQENNENEIEFYDYNFI